MGTAWPEARAEFETALAEARRRHAKSQDLQAATSYYRMALRHASPADQTIARAALEAAYGWFAEGFTTPDLQAAAALLAE